MGNHVGTRGGLHGSGQWRRCDGGGHGGGRQRAARRRRRWRRRPLGRSSGDFKCAPWARWVQHAHSRARGRKHGVSVCSWPPPTDVLLRLPSTRQAASITTLPEAAAAAGPTQPPPRRRPNTRPQPPALAPGRRPHSPPPPPTAAAPTAAGPAAPGPAAQRRWQRQLRAAARAVWVRLRGRRRTAWRAHEGSRSCGYV